MSASIPKCSRLLLLGLLLPALAAASETVSQEQAITMIHRMDQASAQQDIQQMAALLHPDARISIKLDLFGRLQHIEQSRDQYLQCLYQAWQSGNDHIEVLGRRVILEGERAILEWNTREYLWLNGRVLLVEGRSHETVRIVGGQPLITRMHIEGRALGVSDP